LVALHAYVIKFARLSLIHDPSERWNLVWRIPDVDRVKFQFLVSSLGFIVNWKLITDYQLNYNGRSLNLGAAVARSV
jgi:hypothetical protein